MSNKSYTLTDAQIDEVVDLILTTRDFCGDESDALREWRLENNVLITFGDSKEIRRRINAEWASCQVAAGVKKPLTDSQRRKAYADLAA
jgi:hypothetical protein